MFVIMSISGLFNYVKNTMLVFMIIMTIVRGASISKV